MGPPGVNRSKYCQQLAAVLAPVLPLSGMQEFAYYDVLYCCTCLLVDVRAGLQAEACARGEAFKASLCKRSVVTNRRAVTAGPGKSSKM